MRDIVYNVFDIISYFVQGMLLVNLLKETQPRFPFKKYHSAAILLGQYVAVQIFLHYSTGNLSEAGPMADCLRQNRIPKIMDWGFGILKCVRKNIMEKRKLPFGRMSLNWRLCFRNE